ncbi:MAG TPA: hypothetical protein VH165_15885, partial [Kofleriaceae bacterium]|nr:hypothetical protein [Kofleriaceae bacterium]
MTELARGSVADRPWGRTLAALGLRGVSGQLTLVADGKRFIVAFEHGAVVAASSPLTSDAAVRVALTGHLVSSSQVPEIARRQALAPDRDEIDVIAELARLGPDHALRLRRRVIAQRAARTFSLSQGEFLVTDRSSLPILAGCALDVRAVIYMGARTNLSEHRLTAELDQLGSWFRLKPSLDDDLPQFGFADLEQPVIERLRDGGTLEELEEFAVSFVDARTVRAVVYALASYNACDAGPPRPRRIEEAAIAKTGEMPRLDASGAVVPQPGSRGAAPIVRTSTPQSRSQDPSELTPISIARMTPVSELTPTSIARVRPISEAPRPARPTPMPSATPRQPSRTTPSDMTPLSIPRAGRPTPAPAPAGRPAGPEPGPTASPRQRPVTEGTPISMPRAARPTPMPTSAPGAATSRPIQPISRPATPGSSSHRTPPTSPGGLHGDPDAARAAQIAMFDAPTQRDSSAHGSDPGLRPAHDIPAPRDASIPGPGPGPGPGLRPLDARASSDPALRRPQDGSSAGPGLPDTAVVRGGAEAGRRSQDGSSAGLRLPDAAAERGGMEGGRRPQDGSSAGQRLPDAGVAGGGAEAGRRSQDDSSAGLRLRLDAEGGAGAGRRSQGDSSAGLRLRD